MLMRVRNQRRKLEYYAKLIFFYTTEGAGSSGALVKCYRHRLSPVPASLSHGTDMHPDNLFLYLFADMVGESPQIVEHMLSDNPHLQLSDILLLKLTYVRFAGHKISAAQAAFYFLQKSKAT